MGAGACTTTPTTTMTRQLGQLCVMLLPVDVWFFFAIYFINELRAEPPLIFNGLLIYAFAATVAALHYASNMLQQPGKGGRRDSLLCLHCVCSQLRTEIMLGKHLKMLS